MIHRARIGCFNRVRVKQVRVFRCESLRHLLFFLLVLFFVRFSLLSIKLCTKLKKIFSKIFALLIYAPFAIWLIYLLLISGDVHPNPGPAHSDSNSFRSVSSTESYDCLSLLHLNIRSIRNKIDFIQNELLDYDILCFTETHLGIDFQMSDINFEGFHSPVYKNRTDSGGGVIIYSKSELSITERLDLCHPRLELVWIELSTKTKKFLIGCIYRPPSETVDFWIDLNITIERAMNQYNSILLAGDLNEDLMNPNLHHLKDIIALNNMINIITLPTRITEHSSTLLDPIIVTDNLDILNSGVIPVDVSDHLLTFVHFRLGYKRHTSFKRRVWLYNMANFVELNRLINSIDWFSFFQSFRNVNLAAGAFVEKIKSFASVCIPNKMVTIRCNDKPWYDNKIRKESRKRDRLKRKALKSNTELSWTNYKKCRNKVNNMIKEAKLRFFGKLELSDFRFNDQSQF